MLRAAGVPRGNRGAARRATASPAVRPSAAELPEQATGRAEGPRAVWGECRRAHTARRGFWAAACARQQVIPVTHISGITSDSG